LHLKYALEVAKTNSINKAAENMFMGQPNLSRAIKELENSLGVKIFARTSKGMTPTPEGEEFLRYARQIISQVEYVENMFSAENVQTQKFSLSCPRASYIYSAFLEFCKCIDMEKHLEFYYQETNNHQTINNLLDNGFNLGIVRYRTTHEKNFKRLLESKLLSSEIITEFKYKVLVSKNSPLAKSREVSTSDLENMIEIAHADTYVPSMPTYDVQKEELTKNVSRHIFVYERFSQYDLLSTLPKSYIWVSPMPSELLDNYNLVQLDCVDNDKVYKDVLIFKTGYKFSEFDDKFIVELVKSKRNAQR
ncbi:MAG: LysR family transcriptional regulator, partial [Acutalibacteraceae bacterium]